MIFSLSDTAFPSCSGLVMVFSRLLCCSIGEVVWQLCESIQVCDKAMVLVVGVCLPLLLCRTLPCVLSNCCFMPVRSQQICSHGCYMITALAQWWWRVHAQSYCLAVAAHTVRSTDVLLGHSLPAQPMDLSSGSMSRDETQANLDRWESYSVMDQLPGEEEWSSKGGKTGSQMAHSMHA